MQDLYHQQYDPKPKTPKPLTPKPLNPKPECRTYIINRSTATCGFCDLSELATGTARAPALDLPQWRGLNN